MTEAEWLANMDPQWMLAFLGNGDPLSDRKARLLACAAVRRVWHLLADDRSRRAVEVAERHADGQADFVELESASAAAAEAARAQPTLGMTDIAFSAVWATGAGNVRFALAASGRAEGRTDQDSLSAQAALVRCVIANPFHPTLPVAPAVLHWNGGTVVRLAEAAYKDRLLPSGHLDPERLAVLADALEDAGAEAELVAHLRSPGPHVRGCSALDSLLAKE
jgi:hypothetical protein